MNRGLSWQDCSFLGAMFLLTLIAICAGWSSVEQHLDRIEAQITCESTEDGDG